jgi:diaminohydroxyphosphoribosylaminopyrimidine deaminase/5-amino-6-(5-phosphoribosylamino)uracil reductase
LFTLLKPLNHRAIFLLSFPVLDEVDLKYLRHALELAWVGLGRNSPNPLVGSVAVKGGRIIGEGAHLYEKIDHAETVALRQAGKEAGGSTLYVSLEPCCHHGRTPPCTEGIIKAGVKRVVYAIDDPYSKASGKCAEILTTTGVHLDKCDDASLIADVENQNRFYLCHKRNGRPWVTCKAAMSLDGCIATHAWDSQWITHKEGRAVAQLLRGVYDAVLVGARTAITDNPELTYRPDEVGDVPLPDIIFPYNPTGMNTPLRVVIDSELELPHSLDIYDMDKAPSAVICSEAARPDTSASLEERGVRVIRVPDTDRGLSLETGLMRLASMGVQSLLVEGGGETIGAFFDAGLVDEVNFILAPKIIGGRDAVHAVEGLGPDKLAGAKNLKNMKSKWLGEDLLVVGRVMNGPT